MARWGLRQSGVVGSRKPQGGVGHTAIDGSWAVWTPGHSEADLRVKFEKGAKALSARRRGWL